MALPAFELGTFECFAGFSTALANLVLADSNIARYDSNRHGKEARRADKGLPAMTRARRWTPSRDLRDDLFHSFTPRHVAWVFLARDPKPYDRLPLDDHDQINNAWLPPLAY